MRHRRRGLMPTTTDDPTVLGVIGDALGKAGYAVMDLV
jgi:hypothetical protein